MMLQRIWNQDPQRRPMSAPPIGSSEVPLVAAALASTSLPTHWDTNHCTHAPLRAHVHH